MEPVDLSREGLLKAARLRVDSGEFPYNLLHFVEKQMEQWDLDFNSFEIARNFLDNFLDPSTFEWDFFANDGEIMHNIVSRHNLIEYLITKKNLNIANLEGKILDVGSFYGGSVDALSLYGGDVTGIDTKLGEVLSPRGIKIIKGESREYVRTLHKANEKLSLMACFDVDMASGQSDYNLAIELYRESVPVLVDGGQVLYTFSRFSIENREERYRELFSLSNGQLVKLPDPVNKREDYVFIAVKNTNI